MWMLSGRSLCTNVMNHTYMMTTKTVCALLFIWHLTRVDNDMFLHHIGQLCRYWAKQVISNFRLVRQICCSLAYSNVVVFLWHNHSVLEIHYIVLTDQILVPGSLLWMLWFSATLQTRAVQLVWRQWMTHSYWYENDSLSVCIVPVMSSQTAWCCPSFLPLCAGTDLIHTMRLHSRSKREWMPSNRVNFYFHSQVDGCYFCCCAALYWLYVCRRVRQIDEISMFKQVRW